MTRKLISFYIAGVFLLSFTIVPLSVGQSISELPGEPEWHANARSDWLIDSPSFKAGVFKGETENTIVLSNGLVSRMFRIKPNAATVRLDNLMTDQSLIRGVKPEATISIDGRRYDVGGLVGQPNYAYLTPEWLDTLEADPGACRFVGFEVGIPSERMTWKRVRHHAPEATWPPPGAYLRMDYELPPSDEESSADSGRIRVSVHYELYDGIPVFSKWITVHNGTDAKITVDRFTSEQLAVVEHSNWVEKRDGVDLPRPDTLHVETEMAFGGFNHPNANRHAVHWRPDPAFSTQVNYLKKQPCLLVVEPTYGPAQDVLPGKTFESFRAFELLYDATDRERRGLALRRMYRTIAPWTTENPLMMHLRHAGDPEKVKQAVEQCADVGFEMVILSFGSGFNMENDDPVYIAQWKEVADYASAKGIEIGAYSLLSSRRIGDGNDIVCPEEQRPTHGNCPALASPWGQAYFKKLYSFYEQSGFTLLEHDGSYPGDVDITARPPLQKGITDSRWVQWRIISDFYKWCRGQGVYLNVPDYYFLSGSNKCGMGYREVNWSLPRAQQVIHTRQNIYDGTWVKTPSMGWMFVPLTQYHGGGAAATIEPLDEHLDHYERMLYSNLAMGVQACYRGPRLYDTDRTRKMVKKWVDWFKDYRDILESDVIHGRRADGRDLDWMLHVNPDLDHKGMLVVFNPLNRMVEKTLHLNLYYTGLINKAMISHEGGAARKFTLARDYSIDITVQVPEQGMTWYVVR